jgi:hypothetical protein
LPPNDPIAAAFEKLMAQDELTPDWLKLRHRLTFALRRLSGTSKCASDVRPAIFGFLRADRGSRDHRTAHFAQRSRQAAALSRQLYAWAAERFGARASPRAAEDAAELV